VYVECAAGSGSILAMVQTASQRNPDVICGKPNKPMFDVLVSKYNIDPKKTLMIGDRYVCLCFYLLTFFFHNIPAFQLLTCALSAPVHDDMELRKSTPNRC